MKLSLTHLDETGQARMVDVGNKPDSQRAAVAGGEIRLRPETLGLIRQGLMKKGDVLAVAQIAGILAAKRTADLIPLCHPIPINHIEVNLELDESLPGIRITAAVQTVGKTGAEMEALTAVAVAALTVYDMVKAVEKADAVRPKVRPTTCIQNIRLIEKHGGQSGDVDNSEAR